MTERWTERVYTLETRISKQNAVYFKEFSPLFAQMCRRIWQDLKHDIKIDSKYVVALCHRYGFMSRTVNSALRLMNGRMSALKELQKVQIADIENKTQFLNNKIKNLSLEIDKLKAEAYRHPNNKQLIIKYKNKKSKLYSLQNRKNRYAMKIRNFKDRSVDTLSLCFGSKKQFNKQYNLVENGYKTHEKWLNDFRKLRDRQVYYIGSRDTTRGNQQFQTYYNKSTNKFYLQIRKENAWCKDKNDKYLFIETDFKYQPILLRQMLYARQSVSYMVTCKNGKWYIDASFRCNRAVMTSRKNGCVGLDFNNGFISVTETDGYGNICHVGNIDLQFHGSGNRAKSEMSYIVSKIVRYTRYRNKALSIEDLNFSKKKSTCIKRGKKQYNQMIHMLDYSRYKKFCEDYSKHYGVELLEVNPAYTSKIGRSKYANSKKLSVHNAAAYVIARRGQGFIDRSVA